MSTSPTVGLRLTGANLIDGTGTSARPATTIDIGLDGMILDVRPDAVLGSEADRSRPDRTVSLLGRSVTPGFVDAHVHFSFAGGMEPFGATADPVLADLATARRMEATLRAGVTSARDLGGVPAGFTEAQRLGAIAAPRLQTAGRIIGHTAGHCDCTQPNGFNFAAPFVSIADDEREIRVAVRTLLREGATVVKVCATGGMGSPHDDPDDEDLTEAEMRAVVDEAVRHRGRPVAAHAQGTAGVMAAIRAGVSSVEHGYGIGEEGCALAIERGVFIVPTLATALHPLDRTRMTEGHYAKKSRWSETTRENIARAIELGVPMAMGTDAGVSPHAGNLHELVFLVELGMTPIEAIRTGTSRGAELLGWDHVGALVPGRSADLVVFDSDPSLDIHTVTDRARLRAVVQNGALVHGSFD